MHPRAIIHILGFLLGMVSLSMGCCAGASFFLGDKPDVLFALGIPAAAGFIAGIIICISSKNDVNLSRTDGFAVAVFGWALTALFGAVPYLIAGAIRNPVDAVFESVSGFTTTGASVVADVEALPKGILLWRSMTQWLGGMGVLLLCIAVLPLIGGSGMQLFQAEMPGPTKERLTPRIAVTAKMLWGVYLLLTGAQILILRAVGISWFDAVCHTFTTLSGGGFSTRNLSVAGFQNPAAEIVIMLFMLLGGTSFSLHFYALYKKSFNYLKDSEFKYYLAIFATAGLLLSLNILGQPGLSTADAFRTGLFQAASILTTTGYSTADFNTWPLTSHVVLIVLMIIGGCAGSTGGGIKVMRAVVAIKSAGKEIRTFFQPQAVVRIKMSGVAQDPAIVAAINSFVLLFGVLFVLACLAMSMFTPDFITAVSSVAASFGNVGPGLGAVGPAATYAAVPAAGKGVLMLCMLLGRLELYTVLVFFIPEFWRT